AAEQQRLLDRVLRALVPDHPPGPLHRPPSVPPGQGLLEHVEVLTAHQLGAHPVEDHPPAGQRGGIQAAGGEQFVAPDQAQIARRPRAGTAPASRTRSPSPFNREDRGRLATLRWAAGIPRRRSESSITSSWISAAAWKSSSAAAAATAAGTSSPPAPRQPQ